MTLDTTVFSDSSVSNQIWEELHLKKKINLKYIIEFTIL